MPGERALSDKTIYLVMQTLVRKISHCYI